MWQCCSVACVDFICLFGTDFSVSLNPLWTPPTPTHALPYHTMPLHPSSPSPHMHTHTYVSSHSHVSHAHPLFRSFAHLFQALSFLTHNPPTYTQSLVSALPSSSAPALFPSHVCVGVYVYIYIYIYIYLTLYIISLKIRMSK